MKTSRLFKGQAARFAAVLSACVLAIGSGFAVASSARADILVVAPHPDDDVLTSAGVIYRARQAGTVVWVMYMTNGDYAPSGTAWGIRREGEAVAAQALLGVPEDHLVFLGYPDGSLQNLYGAFFNTAYVPARDGYQGDLPTLQAMSNVTYASRGLGSRDYHNYAFGSSAPNRGSNVQADLVHFLTNRAPSDIYVTGRCDRHPDHTTTYEFLMSALTAVRTSNSGYDPIVHQTVVWAGFNTAPDADDWPLAPNPATYFTEPVRVASCLATNSLVWSQRETLDVPAPMQVADFGTNLKSRAIDLHDSQGGFTAITVRNANDGHISAFVHRDEFFYPFRASGSRPALDAGTRPPPVDAGAPPPVDAGAPPPVDAGTPPPVDAGTRPVDAGTPIDGGARVDAGGGPLDAGTAVDSGRTSADAGAQLADAGAPDAGPLLDGAARDAGASPDAAVADAGNIDASRDAGSTGQVSAFPGDAYDDDVDSVIQGDGGETPKHNDDSGCSVAMGAGGAQFSGGVFALALATILLRRRRAVP